MYITAWNNVKQLLMEITSFKYLPELLRLRQTLTGLKTLWGIFCLRVIRYTYANNVSKVRTRTMNLTPNKYLCLNFNTHTFQNLSPSPVETLQRR